MKGHTSHCHFKLIYLLDFIKTLNFTKYFVVGHKSKQRYSSEKEKLSPPSASYQKDGVCHVLFWWAYREAGGLWNLCS